jgi:hypothetical protein
LRFFTTFPTFLFIALECPEVEIAGAVVVDVAVVVLGIAADVDDINTDRTAKDSC